VCRLKASAKDALIRRYGEGGYNVILASVEPLASITQSRILIFILT
jgi:hypothetical protein